MIVLYSSGQWMRVGVAPYPCWHLWLLIFLLVVILMNAKWFALQFYVAFSLHDYWCWKLFHVYILVIHVSSFVKCLFKSFAHFCCSCCLSFYYQVLGVVTLDTNPVRYMYCKHSNKELCLKRNPSESKLYWFFAHYWERWPRLWGLAPPKLHIIVSVFRNQGKILNFYEGPRNCWRNLFFRL